jgi:hypothetical protein
MALTKEQKTKVRQAMTAGAQKRGNAMRDRMEFEQKRDAIAYELVEKRQAERAQAKADGNPGPEPLVWADALTAAEAEMKKKPKPSAPAADASTTSTKTPTK